GDGVHLVEAEDHRLARGAEHLADVAVARSVRLRHVDEPQGQVHLAQAPARLLHHALVHAVHGLVDPRGVEEHDLALRAVHDGQDAVPGGLRLVGDDRHLLADQAVHQRRLPHVGPAHHGHEAGPEAHAVTSAGLRRKRTRLTRFLSASTTSTTNPLRSIRSPALGTRPKADETSPPTVPTPPSARVASRACSSRSTFTRPATSTAPSGSTLIGSASTSYSSFSSPTSSSTMSSTVTRPAVPPYSSTTTANVNRPAWNSFKSSAIFLVSGIRWTGRTSDCTRSVSGPSCSMKSRTRTAPWMSSRFSPYTMMRLY